MRGNLKKYNNKNIVQRALVNNFLKNIANTISKANTTRILDAGCGEGMVGKYLISKNDKLHICGIDIDEEAIKEARSHNVYFDLRKGDIHSLDYASKEFELVLALEVLEHLPDMEKAIMETKRVAGKYCIYSVPFEPYFRICNFLRFRHITAFGNTPEHVWNWGPKGFLKLLKPYFNKKIKLMISFPWMIAICEV
ncbi:MAG: class I SAM-dependent methyltransferase [Candidatus Omnitrophota bacterium]|jgi:predicted TPR repeat methyltransferase